VTTTPAGARLNVVQQRQQFGPDLLGDLGREIQQLGRAAIDRRQDRGEIHRALARQRAACMRDR
jgi:hypothetical protein